LRAILFDIGRVLVRVDLGRAMGDLAEKAALSPAELWSIIEKDPQWPDWQEGRIQPRDWCLRLGSRLGGKVSFEKFCELWNAALDPEPVFGDAFFEQLGRKHRLALVSNTDPIHVAHLEANYTFFRYFPGRIYSCRVGASKPHPLIYGAALKTCRVPAGEALFIDDVPAFVEGARRLGMEGLVFETPEKLRADLEGLGIDLG
jgi:putative hydrolase of the HAD superfamily